MSTSALLLIALASVVLLLLLVIKGAGALERGNPELLPRRRHPVARR